MGFIQKLAKRYHRVYIKKAKEVKHTSKVVTHKIETPEIPVVQKKNYKYYINPKNWFKWL